jgi:hypothetical protein
MYTLKEVLELVNAREDIYCELYQGGSYICEGWLQGSTLKPDTKIESYRLDYDSFVEEYLVLHLA